MSFDFAVNDSSSTVSDEDTEAADLPFESNEIAEIYISSGDWKRTLGKYGMLYQIPVPEGAKYTTEVGEGDDKRTVLKELKIQSDDTLEDVGRLLGKYSDAHPQQKLHMVASLLKSTAGKMQRDNDHAIGFRDGKTPDEDFDEGFSYAFNFRDLPSINWDDLDGGERESLEEIGVDLSTLGFDTNHGGPKILVINGQRLPIAVEEGDEVMGSVELLQQLPNEPSAWNEDGFRESSDPSVFGDSDTDKVAEGDDEGVEETDTDEVSLAANPEAISDFTVEDIKGAVTDITSRRTLRRLLEIEQKGENRSVTERIEQRIRAVEGGEADTEDDEGASDEDVAESVEDVEDGSEDLSDADKNLMSALLSNQENDINTREDAMAEVRSL